MSPGATYATITFLAGVIFLLGWLYVTADNPRSGAMLWKSFLLFAVPAMLSPYPELFQFPLGMWVWVACEEGLKIIGGKQETKPADKFWLIALFGIWELTVDKPFWGLEVAQSGESWDRLAISGLVFVTTLPVLMHTVTAAIYAFTSEGRLWQAFIVSWILHVTFNEAVGYFLYSPMAVIAGTIVLASILTLILWRQLRSTEPGTP